MIDVLAPLLLSGMAVSAAVYTIGADLRAVYGGTTVQRGPTGSRAVSLTFDDGPDPTFTPRILAVLARFEARATFFVVGQQAERYPAIVRAIAAAGHEVGNHTYRHQPLWLSSPHMTRRAIDDGTRVLHTILGQPPRYFRPPWGLLNWAAYHHCRHVAQIPVLWSLRPEGWMPMASARAMLRTMARQLHPGAIIGLHDGGGLRGTPARMVEALPALLQMLHGRDYRCVTLSGLLQDGVPLHTPSTIATRFWDAYEKAWHAWFAVQSLGEDAILCLGPAMHYGPDAILRDGTLLSSGAEVGELHFQRQRVAWLQRTYRSSHLGLALRREIERSLALVAHLLVAHPRYQTLQALRATTLFWKEATRLGFEVSPRDAGWHQHLLGCYQRLLLRRDHPLGRRRLQGRHLQARTVWLSRQELLQRYGNRANALLAAHLQHPPNRLS